MERIDVRQFKAASAWGSRLLMDMGEHAARIHWTDTAYRWHVNSGKELFVVLDGLVRMHLRRANGEQSFEELRTGDVMLFCQGDEHYAEPMPQARILVIERKDSD